MQFHKFAQIFPLLDDDELAALVEDISEHGLREPVVLFEDAILDGRNRYRACEQAGVDCRFRQFDPATEGDPLAFIRSIHERRDLTASQRAVSSLYYEKLESERARERQAHGMTAPGKTLTQKIAEASESGEAREKAAAAFHVNRQYVSDAKKIEREAPEFLADIHAGKMTITQAKRVLKERKREARRQENRQKVAVVPDPAKALSELHARFATIVIDPPWDWGDEGDHDQLGRARADYSTMSIDQLMQLPVGDFADVDCHLYMWITNRSMPKGFDLIEQWGFRYITALTWVKPHYGMGNYFRGQTEHILFAVRGSQSLKRKDVGTAHHWPRGPAGHSSKPVEFYDLVESCSPGPYLEMFSRSERDDWTMWGESFDAAA